MWRLLSISLAPQVGNIFNESVQDNATMGWDGVPRTTESGVAHHHRYRVTVKSFDAVGAPASRYWS